jgi:hypothetical protein
LDAASTALVLFVRVDDARGNWRDQLSALLGADLPRHVRPTALVPVSSFPVTKHGTFLARLFDYDVPRIDRHYRSFFQAKWTKRL